MLFSTAIAIFAAAASTNALAVGSASDINARNQDPTFVCGSTVPGGGLYESFVYQVNCGKRAVGLTPNSSSTEKSESACLAYCNSVKYCETVDFQYSTNTCLQYYHLPSEYVNDSDWVDFLRKNA